MRGEYGVDLWKAIRKEWNLLSNRIAFDVGNGRRVSFWKDKWCGDETLCVSFPFLFALTTSKEAWVVDVWDYKIEDDGWNPSFSRPFNDWKVDIVESFLSGIQEKRVSHDLEDRVLWIVSKSRKFSVKSLYDALELGEAVPFPRSIIWSLSSPPKAGFFRLGSSVRKGLRRG